MSTTEKYTDFQDFYDHTGCNNVFRGVYSTFSAA